VGGGEGGNGFQTIEKRENGEKLEWVIMPYYIIYSYGAYVLYTTSVMRAVRAIKAVNSQKKSDFSILL